MNILYYSWGENSCRDMVQTLQLLGHHVNVISHPIADYLKDPAFHDFLKAQIAFCPYDFIFTFNYFPIISETAEEASLPYVSWVYDCPHLSLYSDTLTNEVNYIFIFDAAMTRTFKEKGARHIYHLPLAANDKRLNRQLFSDEKALPSCHYDISFVGSLYENTMFEQINYLPDDLRGYLDGIMRSQSLIWGNDLISEVITPELTARLSDYLKIPVNSGVNYTAHDIFIQMLQKKITSTDRIGAINLLAENHSVALFSASEKTLCPKAEYKGTISYLETMPHVFHQSKINLNISLRSITSGIPLRALDILSCGGFLLSNYQPELAEYFKPDSDFVYFEDLSDLVAKTDYYLSHDDERKKIAQHGMETAWAKFSYSHQINKIFEILVQNLPTLS